MEYMIKDHSDSKGGRKPISSKGSFNMSHPTDRTVHIMAFVLYMSVCVCVRIVYEKIFNVLDTQNILSIIANTHCIFKAFIVGNWHIIIF